MRTSKEFECVQCTVYSKKLFPTWILNGRVWIRILHTFCQCFQFAYSINCSTAVSMPIKSAWVCCLWKLFAFFFCFISLGIIDSRRLLKWCIILAYKWLDCNMNDDWCSVFYISEFCSEVLKTKTNKYILCIGGVGCLGSLENGFLNRNEFKNWRKKIAKWCAKFWCDGTKCVEYIHSYNAKRRKIWNVSWTPLVLYLPPYMAIHIWEHINSIMEFHAWLLIECQFSFTDTQIVRCCSCYDEKRAKCWKVGPNSKWQMKWERNWDHVLVWKRSVL